jgi:hypothetical protein
MSGQGHFHAVVNVEPLWVVVHLSKGEITQAGDKCQLCCIEE